MFSNNKLHFLQLRRLGEKKFTTKKEKQKSEICMSPSTLNLGRNAPSQGFFPHFEIFS
jgi:hypothetical protein